MKVLFRVDSGAVLGGGHLARCIALACGLRSTGATVGFITRPHAGHRIHFLEREGFDVFRLAPPSSDSRPWLGSSVPQDVTETREAISACRPVDWLVVDHYAIDAEWHEPLRSEVDQILVIDDLGDRSHICDILVDQVYAATETKYRNRIPDDCRLLLGPRYALLREEFRELRPRTGGLPAASLRHAFVCFGTHDETEETLKALKALDAFAPTDRATVVVGADHPDLHRLRRWTSPALTVDVSVESNRIAQLMRSCDFAIGAGGSMTLERFCLGLPSAIVSVADNQVETAERLHRDGYLLYLGCAVDMESDDILRGLESLNPEQLTRFSCRGCELVDGRGVERTVRALFC